MSDLLNPIDEPTIRDYDRLREDCGLLELPGLALLVLTGEDGKGWLQGQVTNDLRRFDSGNSSNFCLCSVTGQIQAVVEAWALPDRILLTTPLESAAAVLQRVEQMVILEDVSAERGEAYRLFSVQGPNATRRLGELVDLPRLDAGEARIGETPVWCLRSDRTGSGGWDIWAPREPTDDLREFEATFELIGRDAYQIARLEAGIPFFGADYGATTFPKELGPAFETKYVSYHKGCYMGQEVLMRMHSRGHANRQWVGLVADDPFDIGASVAHPRRPDAGRVTSAAYSPEYGHVAAAMLRREFAESGEQVRVQTERGEVIAEVRPMPLLR